MKSEHLHYARRAACYVGYYTLGRHLPRHYAVGGRAGQVARRFLVSRMIDDAGRDINIECGAWFGSGRGISIGDRSDLGVDCLIMGSATIGADVMMGPRCVLISYNHHFDDTDRPMNTQGLAEDRPVVIEDDVWIGASCTILAGVTVGRGSIVAAGSVVTKDIPPYSIAGGSPAKVIRSRIPATGA